MEIRLCTSDYKPLNRTHLLPRRCVLYWLLSHHNWVKDSVKEIPQEPSTDEKDDVRIVHAWPPEVRAWALSTASPRAVDYELIDVLE